MFSGLAFTQGYAGAVGALLTVQVIITTVLNLLLYGEIPSLL